jgi:hypothetical protein
LPNARGRFQAPLRLADCDEDDHSIPATIEAAQTKTSEAIEDLRNLPRLLPDDWPTRLVVDTNTLLDDPDLTIYATTLGRRYMVHVLPVVLGELDELKCAGRIPEIRDAARRPDRRLKGLRDSGNVRVGARVAGDIYAVFEHTEPGSDGLPGWLDLTVPDDRLVASVLLLQSVHPGSIVHVATSDLNLQTKARRRRLASPRTTELHSRFSQPAKNVSGRSARGPRLSPLGRRTWASPRNQRKRPGCRRAGSRSLPRNRWPSS